MEYYKNSDLDNAELFFKRNYVRFCFIVLFFFLLICTLSGWKIYLSLKENKIQYLKIKGQLIENNIDILFKNTENYMQFIGNHIVNSKSNDKFIESLLIHSFTLDSDFNDFYSWTLLNWNNYKDKTTITSREGILKKPYNTPDYYPLDSSKKETWKINIGSPILSKHNLPYSIIPVSMGIDDSKGKYIGSLTSNILIEKIARNIKKIIYEKGIDYYITTRNNKLILKSNNENILDSRFAFKIKKESNLPFSITIGYNKKFILYNLVENILPYTYLSFVITTVFLTVLFVFRKFIISPLINRLENRIKKETLSRIEKEKALSQILEKTSGLIYQHEILNNDIKALYVSEGCTSLTGYKPDEYYGQNGVKYKEVIDKNHFDKVFNQIKSSILNGEPFEISYPITTATGEIKWILNQGAPVKNKSDNRLLFEGMLTDITEMKKVEARMQKIVDDLAISNAELERFAHICSHDLKEPLRTIFSYATLIRKNYSQSLNSDAIKYIDFIETSVLHMKDIVENVLLYSSQNSTKSNKSQVINLNDALDEAVNYLKEYIKDRNAIINKKDELCNVYGNYSDLVRLFQNIISNSIKFCDKNTPIIEIGKILDGEYQEIYIKDNGIGIPIEYHDTIFNLFERLHTKDNYSGTGIGLALCKKIVEQHNGKIYLKSLVPNGTTFFITLKLANHSKISPLPKIKHLTA